MVMALMKKKLKLCLWRCNMIECIIIAERLRSLSRRADNFGKTREELIEEIVMIAEDYEARAERLEKQMETEAA